MVTRADHEQFGVLLLGLLVQTATGAHRLDAEEVCCHICRGALLLEQVMGRFALLSDHARGDGVGGAQLTAVNMSERQLSVEVHELAGKRDRIAAVGPAVYTHEHVLEHHGSPCRGRYRTYVVVLCASSGRAAELAAGLY